MTYNLYIATVQNTRPHIALAILNYNGLKYLQSYLQGIFQLAYPNYSVWLIDNASTDQSVAWATQQFPQLQLVQNSKNGGFAAGYNQGLAAIPHEYVFLINSDVELDKNCLEPLVSHLEKNPSTAFVQPCLLSMVNKQLYEYAGAAGGWIDWLGYPFCRGRVFTTLEANNPTYGPTNQIFWTSGAAMMVRKTVFELLGGFYEYYFMHSEEIDLCWRAQQAGFQLYYEPQSIAFHLGGGSLAMGSPLKTYYNFRNNLVMMARNTALPTLCLIMPVRLLLDMLAAFQFLLGGRAHHSWAVIKAWAALLYWCFMPGTQKWPKKAKHPLTGVYRGSIIIQYFLLGKKNASQFLK